MTIADKGFGRRGAALLLAGALVGRRALAQGAPEVPSPAVPSPAVPAPVLPRPVVPGVVPPPPPAPAIRPSAGPIDKSKAYYVFFDLALDVVSTTKLRRELANLVDAGVNEITVVLSSPGGQIDPVIQTYGFMRALPAQISTHAQGFVQSAATVLFLAGDNRSADRAARFLFHPVSTVSPFGSTGEPELQERLDSLRMFDGVMSQIYRERTRLSAAQIEQFHHEAVIMDAEAARAAGLCQTVADLRMPAGRSKLIMLE